MVSDSVSVGCTGLTVIDVFVQLGCHKVRLVTGFECTWPYKGLPAAPAVKMIRAYL